jgi:hypothetical protein
MFVSIFIKTIPYLCQMLFLIGVLLGLYYYLRSTWKTVEKDWQHLKRLHQIPCDRCVFFTGEYNLKCTVHPSKALNEDAIGCIDYRSPKSS